MAVARGWFITLEGVEGAGKSTLTAWLARDLQEAGRRVTATREPGTSSIGSVLRALLVDLDSPSVTARTEALLFAADRSQHVAEVIWPALERGDVVVCDRYMDSSVAYQGVARELGAPEVRDLSMWASAGLVPDLTVLIDLDPVVGIARKSASETNKMEAEEDLDFHLEVRQAFLDMAANEPDRFVVVDGDVPIEALYEQVWAAVNRALPTPE